MSYQSSAYKKASVDSKVMGETPHGIIRLLLEKLVEKLTVAHELMLQNKTAENKVAAAIKVANALRDSTDILQALSNSLKKDKDDDLYELLSYLYAHIQYQILMANINFDPDPVSHSLGIVSELLEAWNTIPADFYQLTTL